MDDSRFNHETQSYHPNKHFLSSRCFWTWLNQVFNKVDEDRIKAVGPDRAAAEWLLRCGAQVKWKSFDKWHEDYNTLPGGSFHQYKIEQIYANNAAIMHIGFDHLRGLNHLKSIELRKCGYFDNKALEMIGLVKNSLETLIIASCGNVTDEGLKTISNLNNLKKLSLIDLPYIKNKDECLDYISKYLPECEIKFSELK